VGKGTVGCKLGADPGKWRRRSFFAAILKLLDGKCTKIDIF
jgi:hypothetical protein